MTIRAARAITAARWRGSVFRNVMAGGLRALGVKPTRAVEDDAPVSQEAVAEPSEP
uniref:Uncharacterized protein n=1 Tax=Conchiformibius kuhniae TaxID=211502 RepID=A0A8T9MZG8_9NEIS|nr:hypothetical protein LVJ77_00230 [Conchiformibius kuhniae]